MKKIVILIISVMFLFTTQVFAAGIEVLPTMHSKSTEQDKVWVGTFQLVWNDFMDKVVFNPVRFRDSNPEIVRELNRQSFKASDIDSSSYYKTACKIKKNTKKQIAKAIKKKFRETSDLLEKLELTVRNDQYLIYAMLKKDFEFLNEFDKLGKSNFGENKTAEYFGINAESNNKLDNNITVLFYNSPYDFAIKLACKNDDEVYLYKTQSNKKFADLYSDMLKKENMYIGNIAFGKDDELKIPNIKFEEEKSFDELANKRVMGTNIVINQALETIKFNMDNKGVYLKSEAAMTIRTTALMPDEEPRFFYFDDTFVMFIKEKEKNRPYFALRVHNIEKFQ